MKTVAGALAMAAMISLTSNFAHAEAEDAAGTWVMENGKITVHVAPCGDRLCGRIVGMRKPLTKKGEPKRDKHNPNPSLRKRPVIGLTIMIGMKADGNKSWNGEIYNPDDGNTYTSYMKLDNGRMKVKGCVAIICKQMTFERVN